MDEVIAEQNYYEWVDARNEETIEHMEATNYLSSMELHAGQYEKLRVGMMHGERYCSNTVDPASWCLSNGWFRDLADMLSTCAVLSSDRLVMVFHRGNATHTVFFNEDGSFSIYARD